MSRLVFLQHRLAVEVCLPADMGTVPVDLS
jgi:hypothetical protein